MKTYRILYVVKKLGIQVIEDTLCEADQLGGTIQALQAFGYEIYTAIGTNEAI